MSVIRWRKADYLHNRPMKSRMRQDAFYKVCVVVGATMVLLVVLYYWLIAG